MLNCKKDDTVVKILATPIALPVLPVLFSRMCGRDACRKCVCVIVCVCLCLCVSRYSCVCVNERERETVSLNGEWSADLKVSASGRRLGKTKISKIVSCTCRDKKIPKKSCLSLFSKQDVVRT